VQVERKVVVTMPEVITVATVATAATVVVVTRVVTEVMLEQIG